MIPCELLEREHELQALREVLVGDAGPSGRLFAIQGHAGMGKTRLLAAARDMGSKGGLRVLYARGSVLERSFAFGVVRQLLEPVVNRSSKGERKELFAGAAALALPLFETAPVESSRGPSADRALSVMHGLFWLTANLADNQPLLLAVDDLHWSDTPSLEWLGYMLRRLESLPIVIAMALRPGEPGMDSSLVQELTGDPLSTILRPEALSLQATRHLVDQVLGSDPSEEFCVACLEASAGNPLLLGELLQALAREGVVPGLAEVAQVREVGPGAVSRSVTQRLQSLPLEVRAFADALAVLADGADLELAATLAEVDRETAAKAAETLERVNLIQCEPALAFVHPLVRDAVYREMSRFQRGEAHHRAADLLALRRAAHERAAAHLLLAPRRESPAAVATLRHAAREALERSAPVNAAIYLTRALDEPPAAEERAALLVELGSVEAVIRDPDADIHLREALALIEETSTRAEIALTLARLLFWRNATSEALELLEQAIGDLTEQEGELRARLQAEMAGIALSDPSAHAAVAKRLSLLPMGTDTSVGGKMLLTFAAYRDTLRGEARERCIDRVRMALEGGELLLEEASAAFMAIVQILLYTDELDLDLRVMEEARSLAKARGAAGSFAIASLGIARVLGDMGRLFEAEADANAALEMWPPTQPLTKAYAAAVSGHVLLKRGDLAGAEARLAEGGFDSSNVPPTLLGANLLTPHGLLHLAKGDASRALADFRAIGRLLEPTGCRNPAIARWQSGAALALAQLGRRDEALGLAQEELTLSRAWGAPTMIGRSLRALGLVEGGRRGLELLQEAVDVLEESPAGYELLRTQVELGAALRRANRRTAARALLRDCLDRAERTGAGLLASQAREELVATGARPRRLVVTGVDALTASERRVATMARDGMTNREIAQSLFVTTKTIEMHLGHVFGKLGIRSRVELKECLGA